MLDKNQHCTWLQKHMRDKTQTRTLNMGVKLRHSKIYVFFKSFVVKIACGEQDKNIVL